LKKNSMGKGQARMPTPTRGEEKGVFGNDLLEQWDRTRIKSKVEEKKKKKTENGTTKRVDKGVQTSLAKKKNNQKKKARWRRQNPGGNKERAYEALHWNREKRAKTEATTNGEKRGEIEDRAGLSREGYKK